MIEPLVRHTGIVAPLARGDVDTDQIIPKQFLKGVERTGYGQYLFRDWRMTPDGEPRPEFVLNRRLYAGASILVAGENFGCGSSREHAAWALRDFGFRAVLAPNFADIFRENADQNGLAALEIAPDAVTELLRRATAEAPLRITLDLMEGTVADGVEVVARFGLDPFRRMCLTEGLDRIALTFRHEDAIQAYERKRWPPGGPE